MATKKTTKKVTTATPAPKKAAAKPTKTTVTRVVSAPVTKNSAKKKGLDTTLPSNLISIILAEAIGTFILTLVAVGATSYFMLPFYVGLTFMVLVLGIGAISGSHINPAVTFGLWTMRRLKTVLVPFYWASQFLGAMAAVVLLGAISNGAFAIHFNHFMDFSWSIFAIELVGAAIFLFGLAAVINRVDMRWTGRAVGIGMSLVVGLVSTSALLTYAQSSAFTKFQKDQAEIAQQDKAPEKSERTYPREVYIAGPTLNPAVAMAVTERTDSQVQGNPNSSEDEKQYTRLSLEVILATLIGAAIGGNLFLLVNYRSKSEV